MLADHDFIRLRDAIARALAVVPRLEAEDLQAVAALYPMLQVLTGPKPVPSVDELRARAKALGVEELARKARPIQVATFEC